MRSSIRLSQSLIPLVLSAAGLISPARAADAGSDLIVASNARGLQLRVEALDPHILRLWFKPPGGFTREPSLATEPAPTTRLPLRREEQGRTVEVGTDALGVRVDRETLRFDVVSAGRTLVAGGEVTRQPNGAWSLVHGVAPDERLMGLGQDNQNGGRLNRRGTVRDLWAGQKIESGNVTAQYPIPLLLSTGPHGRAYGLFYDNVHHLRFDLAKARSDAVRCDGDGGEIDLYVIDGPTLADVIERYTRLTGRPSLPPLWALGYWQSKCTYYDWKPLDEAYRQLTERGFPVDVMVIDADWPEVLTDYRWAKRWTGPGFTPAEKIAGYERRGVHIVMSQSGPMVKQESPTFASGWAAGVFATDGHGNPVECGWYGGKLLDFTAPRMNEWLWPQIRQLNEQGSSGWWLDLTEPEGEPPQTRYYAGGPEGIHNQYSLLCTRSFEGVQLSVHPNRRPFILTRCGPAGLQRFQAAVWTGDIASDYATFRAHPPEMLNAGLSGFAWWTCDTGGFLTGYYRNDQFGAHARLYERWMQFSVFSPITRAHKAGGAPEPYAFGPAAEQSNRHYLQLRYRLLPYIYSYAWVASRTGLPLVRPLALEFPDDPGSVDAPGDEYLFGRELLVAPVLHEDQVNRSVYFPPGRWFDWDEGCEYEGGRSWVVAAPLNRIPVAVRAGAIIPLAPPMKNTAEKPWDPLTLEMYPSGCSTFTLYRDDGVSFNYAEGASTETRFTSDEDPDRVRLTIEESNKQFAPKEYRARMHLRRVPVAVALDSMALTAGAAAPIGPGLWAWDAETRVLTVSFVNGSATRHVVDVSLTGSELPRRPAPVIALSPVDRQGEASGPAGGPRPHFFPPPPLPARLKAVNYDNGGEGVAFHRSRPAPAESRYRPDDFSNVETTDAGGGFVLSGMAAGEWARYAIDCGSGGVFDLVLRVASAQGGGRLRFVALDREVATVDVPATGGDAAFRDVVVPNLYLSPGELSLLMLVDAPGFALNTIEFRRGSQVPTRYPAALAARTGVVEMVPVADDPETTQVLTRLGREGSSATFGVMSARGGPATLRFHYQGGASKPLPFSLQVENEPAISVAVSPTGEAWQPLEFHVNLHPGANRVTLAGHVDGWEAISLRSLEVIAP